MLATLRYEVLQGIGWAVVGCQRTWSVVSYERGIWSTYLFDEKAPKQVHGPAKNRETYLWDLYCSRRIVKYRRLWWFGHVSRKRAKKFIDIQHFGSRPFGRPWRRIALRWVLKDGAVMSEGGWSCLCSETDFDMNGAEPFGLYWRNFSLRAAKFIWRGHERGWYHPSCRCCRCLLPHVCWPFFSSELLCGCFVSTVNWSHLVSLAAS